ncbi:lysylphosphatidylglycerol synthase transmembrane domain-containing protein [Pontibacter saemangeumensis]|uniref:Lysylphosphatidylglycerol synthase transmembrane domain-containing protein n=1 Tax=Pontibacter saemangeumensis TaxID=1084525 RepID=A0ABP8LMY5_9BACT
MALTREQITAKFSVRKLILPVVLGLGVVGYMLYRSYEPGHLQTLLQASPFWLGMSFLVLFVRDFGYIYRIRYITEKALGWKQSFRVIMLWEFASCALPSVAGGSTVASYLLYKEGIPLGKSIAQVLVTAMLDNFYFLLAVPVVVLVMQGQLLPEIAGAGGTLLQSLKGAFVLSYLLIAVYACTMAYALLVNPAAVKRLLIWVGRRRALRRWRASLFRHANELLVSSGHLRTKGRSYWLHASVSTAFVWTARYLIIGCLIAAFADLALHDHIVIFSRNLIYKIVLFVSVTPGAAGFAEIAFPVFFGVFIGSFTTIVILLYRLLTYYLYLVVGAFVFPRWAALVFRGEKEEASPQPLLPLPNPTETQTT